MKKHSEKELRFFCREFSIMIEAGYTVDAVLDNIIKSGEDRFSQSLYKVKSRLKKGMSLYDSFKGEKSFSTFFLEMVRAGEISGNLDTVMDELSDYYNRQFILKNKIVNIMIYPLILVMTTFVCSVFILLRIIPVFSDIFESGNINPPLITRMIMKLSEFILENFYIFISLNILFIAFTVYTVIYNENVKRFIDTYVFRIPVIGEIYSLMTTVVFSRTMKILLSGGVDIIRSIEISSKVIKNTYAVDEITRSRKMIKRGNSFSNSFGEIDIFPKMYLIMISSGEKSGMFEESFKSVIDFYEKELELKIDKFIKLIEPCLIVFMGLIIGVGIISIVLPMFDVINSYSC